MGELNLFIYKVLIKKTKTKRTFYICANNTNDEKKTCDYISWTKPGTEAKKATKKKAKGTGSVKKTTKRKKV